ncbi:MAG: hypothetical protein KJ062_14365 [Thermoanaerobaculia bacterium]|nr:hypothetical protein [Thermoanaerobaculia bacterium]
MKRLPAIVLLAALAGAGCKVHMPFRFQLAPKVAAEAAAARGAASGPVALRWVPADFPERVDIQGASGYIGSVSRTRIPTGVAIATRVREYLETAVGVDAGARRVVTIQVVEAKSSYAYSARAKQHTIDRGRCALRVEVDDGAARWSESYYSSDEPGGAPPTPTEVLDGVWDEVSAALARDILRRLGGTPPS